VKNGYFTTIFRKNGYFSGKTVILPPFLGKTVISPRKTCGIHEKRAGLRVFQEKRAGYPTNNKN